MLKNYDNFFFPASDLEQGREFYQNILGLSVKFDFSDHGLLAFKVGNKEHDYAGIAGRRSRNHWR